jgi:hypothetical protein
MNNLRVALIIEMMGILLLCSKIEPQGSQPARKPLYPSTISSDIQADAPWRINANSNIPLLLFIRDNDTSILNGIFIYNLSDRKNSISTLEDDDFTRNRLMERYSLTSSFNFKDVKQGLDDSWIFRILSLNPTVFGRRGEDIVIGIHFDLKRRFDIYQIIKVHWSTEDLPNVDDRVWFYGDTHYHSEYSDDNRKDFGGPIEMARDAGIAMGLDWLTVTDHASGISTINNPRYRSGISSANVWGEILAKINILNRQRSNFILFRSEELAINDSNRGVLNRGGLGHHLLIYNSDRFFENAYKESRLRTDTGWNGSDYQPNQAFSDLETQRNAFGYAAHPFGTEGSRTASPETGGHIWPENLLERAITNDSFRGMQFWNGMQTLSDKSTVSFERKLGFINPFGSNMRSDSKGINQLTVGLRRWDEWLIKGMRTNRSNSIRKLFAIGGSDAHGDFNYTVTRLVFGDGIDFTNNAFAKVRTAVFCPNGMTQQSIMNSLRNGHSVMTNGPMVVLSLDVNGDQRDDFTMGDDTEININSSDSKQFIIKGDNTSEFGGRIRKIRIIRGRQSRDPNRGAETISEVTVNSSQFVGNINLRTNRFAIDKNDGSDVTVNLPDLLPSPNNGSEWVYFRIEAEAENSNFKGFTNPIWIKLTTGGLDLVADSIDGPSTGTQGSSINVRRRISNQGGSSAGRFVVRYYLSTNTNITSSDNLLGEETISSLSAGATSDRTVSITIPSSLSARQYYLGMIVDAAGVISETEENNNRTYDSGRITLGSGGGIDLVADSIDGPSSGTQGSSINVRRRISNQGGSAASRFIVRYYLSTNTNITSSDNLLGEETISSLSTGATSDRTVSITIPSSISARQYYLGMIVDATGVISETEENNNRTYDSGAIALTPGNDRGGGTITLSTSGARRSGSIDAPQDTDDFTFTGRASDVVRIELNRATDSSLDPLVELYFNNSRIARDDDGGPGNNSLIDNFTLPSNGTYTIRARGFSSTTGTYELALTRLSSGSERDRIAIGQTKRSTISRSGERDNYVLTINSSKRILIHLNKTSSSSLDPFLFLYDGENNLIAQNDDGGPGNNSQIQRTLSNGTYLIQAAGFGTSTGSYDLTVESLTNTTAQSISFGQTKNGSISTSNEQDEFSFNVTGERIALIWLTRSSGSSLDPYLYLYSSSNTLIESDDDGGTGNNAVVASILSSGSYRIRAAGFGNTTGSYRLTLEGDQGINFGQSRSGRLENADDIDIFSFSVLGASTEVTIDAQSSSFDPAIILIKSRGSGQDPDNITGDDDSGTGTNSRIVHSLQAGSYYILVASVNDNSGNYTLSLRGRVSGKIAISLAEFTLFPNSPNPFNNSTSIIYSLLHSGPIKLGIFDIQGQKIKTLENGTKVRGIYEAIWDGTNENGFDVSTGTYFVRLETNGIIKVNKMMLVK